MNVTQKKRAENGLCIMCGKKAKEGRCRCEECTTIESQRAKARREKWSAEKRLQRLEYERKWREDHPDRMKMYSQRQKEKRCTVHPAEEDIGGSEKKDE